MVVLPLGEGRVLKEVMYSPGVNIVELVAGYFGGVNTEVNVVEMLT